MIFALDKNLGFVVEDLEWQTFFKKFKIKPILYDNMKELTEEMEKNTVALSYLPAANFFYFRTDQFYTPITNALFTSNKTDKIGSLLIVSKQSPIQSLSQLKNKSLGYIHPYCTTSYFTPPPPHSLFNGFIPFEQKLVEIFIPMRLKLWLKQD